MVVICFFTLRDKGQKESEFPLTIFDFLPAASQPEKITTDKLVIFVVEPQREATDDRRINQERVCILQRA